MEAFVESQLVTFVGLVSRYTRSLDVQPIQHSTYTRSQICARSLHIALKINAGATPLSSNISPNFTLFDSMQSESKASFKLLRIKAASMCCWCGTMEGGVGDASYAHNSSTQAGFLALAQPVLLEALKEAKMELPKGKVVRIADLGCSSGTNTVIAMDFVVDALSQKFTRESLSEIEVQAFFSDLRTNDFNTLFSLFAHEQGRPYFYAAVPGSFYERLFPCSSIHVAMSNSSLHWLSKVPNAVLDKNSLAWNSGSIWVDQRSRVEAMEAFQQQAHEDLCRFLHCRAHEVVGGGLLSLVMLGRSDDQELPDMVWGDDFQLAWEDLVTEGLISQDTMDNFNVPLFFRRTSDVTRAVEETASFKILHLECSSHSGPNYTDAKARAEVEGKHFSPREYAFERAMALKALFKRVVREHLGTEELVEELFRRMDLKTRPTEPAPIHIVVAILERYQV